MDDATKPAGENPRTEKPEGAAPGSDTPRPNSGGMHPVDQEAQKEGGEEREKGGGYT